MHEKVLPLIVPAALMVPASQETVSPAPLPENVPLTETAGPRTALPFVGDVMVGCGTVAPTVKFESLTARLPARSRISARTTCPPSASPNPFGTTPVADTLPTVTHEVRFGAVDEQLERGHVDTGRRAPWHRDVGVRHLEVGRGIWRDRLVLRRHDHEVDGLRITAGADHVDGQVTARAALQLDRERSRGGRHGHDPLDEPDVLIEIGRPGDRDAVPLHFGRRDAVVAVGLAVDDAEREGPGQPGGLGDRVAELVRRPRGPGVALRPEEGDGCRRRLRDGHRRRARRRRESNGRLPERRQGLTRRRERARGRDAPRAHENEHVDQ